MVLYGKWAGFFSKSVVFCWKFAVALWHFTAKVKYFTLFRYKSHKLRYIIEVFINCRIFTANCRRLSWIAVIYINLPQTTVKCNTFAVKYGIFHNLNPLGKIINRNAWLCITDEFYFNFCIKLNSSACALLILEGVLMPSRRSQTEYVPSSSWILGLVLQPLAVRIYFPLWNMWQFCGYSQ